MNEVTKIHLGRQAFTIAVDAHRELRAYLDAIKDQVKDKDVVEEVELRMAELLVEHGVTDEQVILIKDVSYLKSQLGDPSDFTEADEAVAEAKPTESKRLFRDTNNALFAGVAAGLANYFGVDVVLVRILFIIAVIAGGWGIILYIALWLIVPEARTSSERLQMAGKPVTVSSLKEAVTQADLAGAAKRANTSLAGPINAVFRFFVKLFGIGTIVVGLCLLLAFVAVTGYGFVHTGSIFGQDIFPVGFREHLLLNLGAGIAILSSSLVIIFGIAIFRQKWPIKSWATGALIGLLLLGSAGAIALAADVAPQVNNRYSAQVHTNVRTVQPFTAATAVGDGVTMNYQTASQYAVSFKYFDNPNLSNIKTTVTNGTLVIDSSQFDANRHCPSFCLPETYNVVITVESPTPPQVDTSESMPIN